MVIITVVVFHIASMGSENPSFLHSILIVSFFAWSECQEQSHFVVICPVDLPPNHFTSIC